MNHDGVIHACDLYYCRIYMLVFRQSNCSSAIKPILFYYRHVSTLSSCSFMSLQGCSGTGTRGNGVPTPFSCFSSKWVWSCCKMVFFVSIAFQYICVLLSTATYAKVYCVAGRSADVTQYNDTSTIFVSAQVDQPCSQGGGAVPFQMTNRCTKMFQVNQALNV